VAPDLLKWLVKRRRLKVLDLAYRQMTLSIDTVTELERAIAAASKGEKEEAKQCISRLFLVEVEIDDLRRAVFEELTRGSLPPKDREDIMHLVKRLDVMADCVKDSARNVLILLDADVPHDIWDISLNIARSLVECATTLRMSIERLGDNLAEARSLAIKVDQIEGRVDDQYLEAKKLLLKHCRDVNPAILLILRDLIESMEHVADNCDDTADYVRILTVGRETD